MNTGHIPRWSGCPYLPFRIVVNILRSQLRKLRFRGSYKYKTIGIRWNLGLTDAKSNALEKVGLAMPQQ